MYNLTRSKKLALAAITSMAILIPESAYSLGIGDIKLHSGFNQNLKGEIELLVSPNEEISDLYIGLAPPEKFDAVGIPWSYFLKKIKFRPVKRANGSIFIELSSNESLKELFLSFVLEVSWNKSNLLNREFTVLVDPSASYKSAAAAIRHKRIFSAKTDGDSTSKYTGQYGPVKPTDFIWKIAKKTRYPDISIEQMIMALYKANPDAFYADNINSLAVKEMLNIPEKELALEMSRKEALAAVKEQNMAWKHRDVTDKSTSPEITTDIAGITPGRTAETFDLNLAKKVSRFPDSAASVSSAEKKPKEKQPSAISSAEGLALLARLEKLEQKLDMMQSLLLKDKPSTPSAPTATSDKSALENDVEAKTKPQVSSSEGLALLNKQNELEQKLEMMEKLQTPNNSPAAAPQQPNKPATALQANLASQAAEPTRPAPAPPQNTIQPEPENPMLPALYGVAGGVFLSILGGFFWWQGKRSQQQAASERTSQYSSPALPIRLVNQFKNGSANSMDEDKGFLSDAVDAFDSDHIDPLTEADMYLAHGLYENAESLMRQTIQHHPEKTEYLLKLLDIFLASNNKAAFNSYVAELIGSGNNTPELLNAIAKMEIKFRNGSTFDLSKLNAAPAVDSNISEAADTKQPDVKLANEPETATNQKIAFDLTSFNVEADENTNLETADNSQSETEWLAEKPAAHNDIAFDLSDFSIVSDGEAEVEVVENKPAEIEQFDDQPVTTNEIAFDTADFDTDAVANTGIEFEDVDSTEIDSFADDEATASHEVDFDVFNFDTEAVANPDFETIDDQQENIELSDDESAGNSIAFDLPNFQPQPATNANTDIVDAEMAAGNSIAFDLSDFEIEPEPLAKPIAETVDDK